MLNAMRLNELTGDWNLYKATDRPTRLHIDLERFDMWLRAAERRSELSFLATTGLLAAEVTAPLASPLTVITRD